MIRNVVVIEEVPMNPKSLLGGRRAARELGVHENTLRRWEQAGLVRAIKLPTGVRRYRAEDIDRLAKQMYDGLAEQVLQEEEPVLVRSGR
jgi:hypothetical protein